MPALLRPGWMREIISNPVRQKALESRYTVKRCVGHFFDAATRKVVHVELGEVFLRTPFVFRAAPSSDSAVLVDFEEAAPSPKKQYGSYVIPVQSPMDRPNAD